MKRMRSTVTRSTILTVLAFVSISACLAHSVLHPKVANAISGWAQDALAPPVFCGTLVKIAYDSKKIADASPAYFDNVTGEVVALCDNPMASRGKSPGQRVECPPVQWTCGD